MISVDQTVFTVPGGNCFSACVASLLELELDDVPYFMGDKPPGEPEDWFRGFLDWLRPLGYWAIPLPVGNGWKPEGLCILSGKSPRGDFDHCVVANGLEVVHDPHPSRAGVETQVDVVVLVPVDPRSQNASAYYKDDEPLSAKDQTIIDAAWEQHKAAASSWCVGRASFPWWVSCTFGLRCFECGCCTDDMVYTGDDEGFSHCANGCNWHPCQPVDGCGRWFEDVGDPLLVLEWPTTWCSKASEASTALGWCDINRTWWERSSKSNPCTNWGRP